MRTFGRAAQRVTLGAIAYASSIDAQSAIDASIAENKTATYQIGGVPPSYQTYPNATSSGNVLTFTEGEDVYHLTYSIRLSGTSYYVDTTLTMVDGLVWVEVVSDSINGDTYPQLTTLIQNLKLSPGESPFYAANGIPAQQSIITQIYPDFYVQQIQKQFSSQFATLGLSRRPTVEPIYDINIITKQGTVLNEIVAV